MYRPLMAAKHRQRKLTVLVQQLLQLQKALLLPLLFPLMVHQPVLHRIEPEREPDNQSVSGQSVSW